MVQLQPISNWKSDYTLVTMTSAVGNDFTASLKLAINASGKDGLILDGQSLSATWVNIQGCDYVGALLGINFGMHRIWHVTGALFDVVHFGQRYHEAYALSAVGTVYNNETNSRSHSTSVETTSVETTSVDTTAVDTTAVETTSVETTSVETTSVETTAVETTAVDTIKATQTDEATAVYTTTTLATTPGDSTMANPTLLVHTTSQGVQTTTPLAETITGEYSVANDVSSLKQGNTPPPSTLPCPPSEQELVCRSSNAWGEWSQWSRCSSTCGKGTTTRQRDCLQEKCSGKGKQHIVCETGESCHIGGRHGNIITLQIYRSITLQIANLDYKMAFYFNDFLIYFYILKTHYKVKLNWFSSVVTVEDANPFGVPELTDADRRPLSCGIGGLVTGCLVVIGVLVFITDLSSLWADVRGLPRARRHTVNRGRWRERVF